MAEEIMMENQPEIQPENTPSTGAKIWAAIKEWCRKKVVTLKIKPQIIPLIVLVATSVCFLLCLQSFSKAVYDSANEDTTQASGICIFITTLLSLLSLVSFLNAFPKRKKPNIFFIVLVFTMIAAMIACDVVYYVQMSNCVEALGEESSVAGKIKPGQPKIIAHIVMLAVSAVVFALLPVYSRLIKKINTSVKLDSATENMSGKIDIHED